MSGSGRRARLASAVLSSQDRAVSNRRATYEDLKKVPSHRVAEIINGVLHTFPRPAGPHTNATSVLGGELHGPFRRGIGGPGGWILFDEPELHFGEDVLVPDIGGWRAERFEGVDRSFYCVAPDWLAEMLSPSTATIDRAEKLPIYAREGVRHVWFVDPMAKTLEVFRLDGATYRLLATHHDDARVRIEPFESLELDLSLLWKV